MLRKISALTSCIFILGTATACIPEQWLAYVGSSNLIPKKEASGWTTYEVPNRPIVHSSMSIYDPVLKVVSSGENSMVFHDGFQANDQVKDCYQYSPDGDSHYPGGVTRVVFDMGVTKGWDLQTTVDAGDMCQSILQGNPWQAIENGSVTPTIITDQRIAQINNMACTKDNDDLVCWSTKSKVGFRYNGSTISPLNIS